MAFEQPKPDNVSYSVLINRIKDGTIKIPKFQRDFVWDLDKTAELLDSILKGYPIGTFIIWKTKERINNIKNIGNIHLPETPDGEEVYYILDGQQRITSLFAAHESVDVAVSGKKQLLEFKKLVVNLDASLENNDQQVVAPKLTDEKHVSLTDILNYDPTKKYLESHTDFTESDIQKIYNYSQIVSNYDFSVVYLQKNDIESAIEVFTRINTSGQTLTLFEIMSAKTYDENQNFDMQSKWQLFLNEAKDKGFDQISSTVILHLLSIIISSSKECKRSVILSLDKQDFIDHWDGAISALKDSIDYIRRIFRVPVSKLLPYDTLLVPFSYFFYNTKTQPSAEQRFFLQELFWRLSLSHRYSKASESALYQDIRRVDIILNGERPTYSDISLDLNNPKDLVNTQFSTSDSLCKAILCLLASLEPKDFLDNGKVILDNQYLQVSNSRNYHHFFPKKVLESENVQNSNSIVNITLISDQMNKRQIKTRRPSDYMNEFTEKNKNLRQTLKTHLIDDLNEFGIVNDNYGIFIEKRSERIFEEITKQMEIVEHHKDYENKIESIVDNGESETTEFKSTLQYDRRENRGNNDLQFNVIKCIAGFLNHKGGNLIIGIDDNREVLGLDFDLRTLRQKPNIDGFHLHLVNLLRNHFDTLVATNMVISFPKLKEKVVCWVNVIKSNDLVVVEFKGKDYTYVRMGNSTRSLNRQEQSNYEKERRGH